MAAKFKWNQAALDKIDKLVHRNVIKSVAMYERNLQRLFRMTKNGRVYRRGDKHHVASAPGQAPAIDTGALSQNVAHNITRTSWASYHAHVGVTRVISIKQVLALELGTLDGHLRPRPAWLPAMRVLRQQMREIIGSNR
jgi:hypothetical protein